MAAEATELLHLLKAGRVLQYRQQNVALVSAAEGTEFTITYAERWIAPDLEVAVGDSAIVILSDSPYQQVDPVRYATVTAAERSRTGLQLSIKAGPWPVVEDRDALIAPLRAHPTQPPYFAWRSTAAAMRPPRSDHEGREAWRAAVDRLRGNTFYADSRFARLIRVLDPHGHEVRERMLELGAVATAVVEVRGPSGDDRLYSVLVDSDPVGAAAGGIEGERSDPDGHLHVPIRPLTAGSHTVDLSFVPDPLLSTRLSFTIDAHKSAPPTPPPPPGAAPSGVEGFDRTVVRGLAEQLRRLDAVDPGQWLSLLQDHILPLAADDPVVRSMTAEAAYEIEEWETVIELLADPKRYRPGDAFRALTAGLRYGLPTDVAGLLREIDLAIESNVARLGAELPRLPDGAIHDIATVVLDDLAGREMLDRLLPPVFQQLRDDLALRVLTECAPADPEGWLDRALRRWPDPHRMPRTALSEILTWDINTAALAPYVREAMEQLVDDGEIEGVLELDQRARELLPRADQVRLRTATSRLLFDQEAMADTARGLLLAAAGEAAGLGDPDLAAELAFTMRERWPVGDDDTIDAAIDRLRAVLDDLADFQEWREKRYQDSAASLRPAVEGRVLHVVGGRRQPWADQLETALGLGELRWHESEHGLPAPLEWAGSGDTELDLVVVIWTHCGHATSRGLDIAGVTYCRAAWSRASILDAVADLISRESVS